MVGVRSIYAGGGILLVGVGLTGIKAFRLPSGRAHERPAAELTATAELA